MEMISHGFAGKREILITVFDICLHTFDINAQRIGFCCVQSFGYFGELLIRQITGMGDGGASRERTVELVIVYWRKHGACTFDLL